MMNYFVRMFGKLCSEQITFFCFQQARYVRINAKKVTRTKKFIPANPGFENRLHILQEENPNPENLNSEDLDIDDLESDFMKVGDMHKDYLKEKKASADALAYEITKSKYFKPPKLPNLLMWSEKEQIRSLHQLDPDEWDPESLSRGFPAPVEVIKKVIKSKWKPINKSDIERHDRSVQRNWAALMVGKFNLDINLRCHLLSFSSRRQLNTMDDNSIIDKQVIIHNKPKGSTEFSDIVSKKHRSYNIDENSSAEYKNLVVNIPDFVPKWINRKSCDPRSDSFVVPSNSHVKQKLMPLEDFKEKLRSSLNKEGEDGGELSKRYYEHLSKRSSNGSDALTLNEESLPEMEKLPLAMDKLKKYKDMEAADSLLPNQLDAFKKAEHYEEKIRIPKENQPTSDLSVIYKVKDCFYDSDGNFLYKVPGMS